MSNFTIDSSLFPSLDSPYSYPDLLLGHRLPLSILALNLEITNLDKNLIKKPKSPAFYLRDDMVPKPRPATQLAWERICRLGHPLSKTFLVPFLPALREEDEVGSAIGERGVKLPSLSRRSGEHVREKINGQEYVKWGSVYIGTLTPMQGTEYYLTGSVSRSNITESLILPPQDLWAETAQESIRTRLEFLAAYGIPCMFDLAARIGFQPVTRLLLQFMSQQAAQDWAKTYAENHKLVRVDPEQAESDYKELVEELKNRLKPKDEKPEEKHSKANRFDGMKDLNLEF